MSKIPVFFENVSLMITHYNRSQSLERLLTEIEKAGCIFKEVVVSDDGSTEQHIDFIKDLQQRFNFKLVTTPKNRGLGNNLNKGQDAINTPYTLYIQEDFIPLADFSTHLSNGISLLDEYKDFDTVRFYAYNKYPYLKKCRDGFSQMLFKWWYPGLDKFAYYSDHPHLRRDTFQTKFGRYREGVSGDKTEFSMMMSFIKNKGKSFFYDAHKSVLEQVNSSDEPSTMVRDKWRNSDNLLVRNIRIVYRYFNCYSALFFRKF